MTRPDLPSLFDGLLRIDTSAWPDWAAAVWPQAVKWAIVLASVILIWFLAALVRRGVSLIGRIATRKSEDSDRSSWEIAASLSRLLALILMSPLPLGLAGYDWRQLIETRGPGAFTAVAILMLAVVIANGVGRSLRKFGLRAGRGASGNDTLIAFSASLIKYIIFGFAIVFALAQLGFPAASLAAVLGAAGLAIGLALQDTLKSVAAGVMLAVFRPFRIGDYVTLAGLDGEITDITPFTTSLKQIDNKVVSVTNDQVWGSPLINHTMQTERRLDLFFDVSYSDDLDHALGVLRDTANAHPRVLSKPDTWTGVHTLGDFGIKLRLRAWVATPEFIQVRADLNKAVKQAFDREGITIPFPHQVQVEYKPKAASERKAAVPAHELREISDE